MFVVAGESLIDLVAEPSEGDAPLRLTAHPGGSPFNCAIALARLERPTGFLCPLSSDGFGDRLFATLERNRVGPLLAERVDVPTTLAVVTLDDRGRPRYQFYRGADRAFTREGLIAALPARMAAFQFGGFAPIVPEDAETWLAVADAAAAKGATVSLDPNIRPSLIDDPDAFRARLEGFFDRAHLIKLSDEDLAWLDPAKSVETHVSELLAHANCRMVVVTMGEAGSRGFTADAEGRSDIHRFDTRGDSRGDTVGAGDSFMAATISELAECEVLGADRLAAASADTINRVLRFASVAAGLNCTHKGCVPPARSEVREILAH
jgi:fructokinase